MTNQFKEMGDLHSIAYSSSLHNSSLDLDWDVHNLGVLNADMTHFMESCSPPLFSPLESDLSSGYLQDALFKFGDRSKRRRFLLFDHHCDDQLTKDSINPIQSYWNCKNDENYSENFSYLGQIRNNKDGFSETAEEAISASETFDSSSSSQKDSVNEKSTFEKETIYSIHPISPGAGKKRKKKVITRRVVYPFAVVKPGGVEGDLTLNDINQRILMPPTRPVRHPVGDFACRPLLSLSGDGTGCSLSGKSVVAFTRIHTQGRGTITIIRTKG
ncbi:uncharacterized protein LOC132302430 isoform X2 [Cornus florida]|uniref:uncharacterized protein LOC132302430 isoform X2 n=1 Tax=Cornus florida TaxID=4283 RepID=UPI00289FF9A3|nr:uncharacterized protein LOC132302430 isoform X2 [Cornus florida]